MGLVIMVSFAAVSCLLFMTVHAASISEDQDTCAAAAEQAGVDFDSFKYNVGHMIHSLTVEDVRFFFDENFPMDNDIPTVNTNLTGPPVLAHTPSFPSKFKFPLGSTLDRILLNNDDPKTFFDNGLSSLEELAHAAHMLEMLYTTSEIYKTLEGIEIPNVCPCLVDEEANGIIEELEYLAEVFRFEYDDTKTFEEQHLEISNKCSHRQGRSKQGGSFRRVTKLYDYDEPDIPTGGGEHYYYRKKQLSPLAREHEFRQKRSIAVCPNVPGISDSESWKIWKEDIAGPLRDVSVEMFTNVALYLHCKISLIK